MADTNEIITRVLIGIFFLYLGWTLKSTHFKISSMKKEKALIDDIKNQFLQLLNNIKSKKSKFKSRVNQTVYISSTLTDYGNIELVYLMNKEDVAIFKDNKCIYTSVGLDSEVKKNLISTINSVYNNDINNVVEVMGFVFSINEFERTFNVSVKDLQKQQKNIVDMQKSDVDKIVENNSKKLTLDDILDKISKVGFDNLTDDEKNFLNNIK